MTTHPMATDPITADPMTADPTTRPMTTHYLFLRGINVGGIRVPMPRLREVLTDIGGRGVVTWLATGNVRLEWPEASDSGSASADDSDADTAASTGPEVQALKHAVEAALTREFGYDAYVLVRSSEQVRALVVHYPFAAQEGWHRYVVLGGAVAHDELRARGLTDDDVRPLGTDLAWRCPKGSTTKSVAGAVLAKARYKAVTTTRNLTTLERMLA